MSCGCGARKQSNIKPIPFAFLSAAVHRLWLVWHLCAGVLRFWGGVWGIRSHRRGAQGDFHSKYHSGSFLHYWGIIIFLFSLETWVYKTVSTFNISQILSWLLPLQDSPGVVMCMDNLPHGLQTGQSVVFREVNGMVELNGTAREVSGILSILLIRNSVHYMVLWSFFS